MRPSLATLAEAELDRLCRYHPVGYRPTIMWKNLRVTAGVAYYRKRAIGLSSLLITDRYRLRATVIHEYAHLLAVARYGLRAGGHGAEWGQAMRELGADPVIRHCYVVQRNAKHQKVVYKCLKCGTRLDRARRLPQRKRYVHAECGGDLKLLEIRRIEAA